MIAVQMTKPRINQKRSSIERKQKKRYATTERQSIEEIFEVIDSGIHLTFGMNDQNLNENVCGNCNGNLVPGLDYLAFTVAAALISSVGLVTDSSVTVVASM